MSVSLCSLFIMTRQSECERTVMLCLLRRLTGSSALRKPKSWAPKTYSPGPTHRLGSAATMVCPLCCLGSGSVPIEKSSAHSASHAERQVSTTFPSLLAKAAARPLCGSAPLLTEASSRCCEALSLRRRRNIHGSPKYTYRQRLTRTVLCRLFEHRVCCQHFSLSCEHENPQP